MKRLIALCLCCGLILGLFTGCKSDPKDQPPHYLPLALSAQQDLYDNFWDAENNHLKITNQGLADGSQSRQYMVWEHSIAIFSMYTLWYALDDDSAEKADLKNKFAGEWEFLKNNFTREELTSNFGRQPNVAIDDTGWGAMTYMIMYHVLGDEDAMQLTKECVGNAYEFWKDGEVGNGLWYSAQRGENSDMRFKSMSYVGLMYAALEYTLAAHDDALLEETLALYRWTEDNMLRNKDVVYADGLPDGGSYRVTVKDNLYWMDFNDQRTGTPEKNGPNGGQHPEWIREGSSRSCLFANMAMGAIHADLYAITKDKQYRNRAVETVRAVNDSPLYSDNGVYVNDRDAWANAMFVGPWVRQALTLPGIQRKDYDRLFVTADSIVKNARTEDGYWKAGWSGGTTWDAHSKPEHIMTTGTTVNMITAAALAEALQGASGGSGK